jgi:RND family efflux transporter MFP subunit
MTNPHGRPPISRREKFALTVASTVIILVVGALVGYMMTNKPKAQRSRPAAIAPLVTAREVVPGSYSITIPVMGTVIPAAEVDLKARVGGEVVWVHPEFVEGGLVNKGQTLVKIEPVDYELALTAKKANLETTMADLKGEQGQQEIARAEWELLGLGEDASAMDRELALRVPQLAAKEARLEAARAEVSQAELDLARTVTKAPFNAVIRSTSVDIGAQVTSQSTLANLVESDAFYIQALIPLDRLKWITLPDGPGSPVSIASVSAGNGRIREGRVYKLLSDLEPSGRLARLLIKVDDPLDLKYPVNERSPMLMGDYVSVKIIGRRIEDVYRIDQEYLRDGSMIYTVDPEDRLHILNVDVIWREIDHVLVRGIDPQLRLIVSNLSTPVEGMEVRVQVEGDTPDSRDTETQRHGDAEN